MLSSENIAQLHLLVVDDEPHIRSALVRALGLNGYAVDEADSGQQALSMLQKGTYDLVVLDMRMPGMPGVEVMQRMHANHPEVLIIVLTGHATLESAITAVKSYAVDYLIKPTSIHDIAASVARALQRRDEQAHYDRLLKVMNEAMTTMNQTKSLMAQRRAVPKEQDLLHVGPLTLDQAKRVALVAHNHQQQEVALTEGETAVLANLMQHPGQLFSCQEIAETTWGYSLDKQAAENLVRSCIFRLRHKIEDDPQQPQLVRTVRGRGYMLAIH